LLPVVPVLLPVVSVSLGCRRWCLLGSPVWRAVRVLMRESLLCLGHPPVWLRGVRRLAAVRWCLLGSPVWRAVRVLMRESLRCLGRPQVWCRGVWGLHRGVRRGLLADPVGKAVRVLMRELLRCLGSLRVWLRGVPVWCRGVRGLLGDAPKLAVSIGAVWRLRAGWEDWTPLRGFGIGEVRQWRRPLRSIAVQASTEAGFSRRAVWADLALVGLAGWGGRCLCRRRLF
jgi:hypothetical protein